MEKTVITIDMDKESLREGVTRLIEYITTNPPQRRGTEQQGAHRVQHGRVCPIRLPSPDVLTPTPSRARHGHCGGSTPSAGTHIII